MTNSFGYAKRPSAVLAAVLVLAPISFASETFFDAARRGDVAALKAELDKGVPVDAKWRYDQTALFIAASRGHVDAVKLLTDRGANVNGKDSYYNVTILSAANGFGKEVEEPKAAAVIAILLAKGATGKEALLTSAVTRNKKQLVKVLLDSGEWKPEALTASLEAASAAKVPEVEAMLVAAGAKPAPVVKVDPAVLARYPGVYKDSNDTELKVEVNDGKLRATIGSRAYDMRALDQVTFEPRASPGQKLVFVTSAETVSGAEIHLGAGNIMKFKKMEAK